MKIVQDWSSDGRFLLYVSFDPKTDRDLWALPLDVNGKPSGKEFPVAQTKAMERDGQFSPDGKWVAYQSNESGQSEIYVQRFDGRENAGEGKWQISFNGGSQPRWRADSNELFYIALDDRLMAVPIHIASNGQDIERGMAMPLFPTHVGGALQGVTGAQYVVSRDGQRFLMNTVTNEITTTAIRVILNWKPQR
jgi:eukaryotic-like serine/threonine-protein kinase